MDDAAARAIAYTLGSRVDGAVLTAGEQGYDAARTPFFGHRLGRPVAVVRPKHSSDVIETIGVAQVTGLPLAVRSGGHSWHSTGDGLLLDLGSIADVELDPDGRSVWAGSGLTARELSDALSARDLAVGLGDTGSVGIGGLTLGGGVGFLSRLHGLTIDNVLAAEIVTADGQVRVVDDSHDPDLFWAIRGGGGNFGVVTRFRYRPAHLPRVYGGVLLLPATTECIDDLVTVSTEAPEAVTVVANVMLAPALPMFPPELHGELVIAARICFAGDPADGEEALHPFRTIATPVADLVRACRYSELLDEAPDRGQRPAIKTMFIDRVDEQVGATMLEHLRRAESWLRLVQIRVLGGAINRVPTDATAYAHRDAAILVTLVHGDDRGADSASRWTRELAAALDQGREAAYVNLLGPDDHRVEAAYPEATLRRLRQVKAAHDPANLFRGNVNIGPAPHPPAA